MKQKSIFQTITSFGLLICSFTAVNAQQEVVTSQKKSSNIVNAAKIPLDQSLNSSRVYSYPWLFAPNSYIFDPSTSNDGVYIPVKKAYAVWTFYKYLNRDEFNYDGKGSAELLWEDNHGLIKTNGGTRLRITGSKEEGKIIVPVNKGKKGNAVIAFKVDGKIAWSWHVWVTDDPTDGSTYRSFENVKREISGTQTEVIPAGEWKWMDRNLGAISSSNTSGEWNRSGGLLYQWGRKDPIPPLVLRGDDFYEISGSIGRIRHRQAKNFTNATNFDNLRIFTPLSNSTVENNITLSINNPVSPIYVYKDDLSGPAFYNNNANLMYNWFGDSNDIADNELSELNLWSDNAEGKVDANYNADTSAAPYRRKSPFDPCPNGWRLPSMLVANLASPNYVDDVRIDFSPFGVRTTLGKSAFESAGYHIIKPTDAGAPSFMTGFKVYPNVGFDMSSVGGFNMGNFPGTGQLAINSQQGQYTDQHHVGLWTATMTRLSDATPAVSARALFMVADKYQNDLPDPADNTVKGRYWYLPTSTAKTSDANACRCIQDPGYMVLNYNYPTEYYDEATDYTDGLKNPNTYQIVKNTTSSLIEIPVSKAFSVQSQLLNNKTILNSANYNSLKANVLWSTNTALIGSVSLSNPSPSGYADLSNTKIQVNINPNQSGNAVITLHNGSITNPVYWSWHIWVTDSAISSYTYATETPNSSASNYINYVQKGDVLKTEFMDRNLGATDAFPMVANPLTPNAAELAQIRASTGMQYQWGRKDPIPPFQHADNRASYSIFLGNVAANGTVSYTPLSFANYNNLSGNYIVPYNTYSNASNANLAGIDTVSEKLAKIISYSVKNPLVYMIPSTFAPYNSVVPNYTNGTDWISDEPNLAADRWGRGGEKSVYDPCPEGWRIPDLTSTSIISNRDYGISPWYKLDKKVATSYSVINDYLGTRVRNSTTTTIGYMYNNPAYNVGNFPNSGSRGFRSVTANQTADGTFNVNNYQYPGVWTAALNSNYIGRSVNILFDAASSANRMIAFHDNNDPYFGMNCRCVKVKTNAEGDQAGPIPAIPVTQAGSFQATNVFTQKEIEAKETKNQISLFPNPVQDYLYIKADVNKDYYFQIYNASGQLVRKGKFENSRTNISDLTKGFYLIRINDSELVVKIMKK
ncbi:T9SS type A sorting domain-containing protein [Chryseobacterium sp.]|uniref:T9SS type A sorting domain-containing protein n=1 Tax=Chryseobacterium sp. TaxID=1871047 RepID=UPI002899F9C6|nr:T9SS type A sorting domain-containing protein [Chryseobacterium sp.]